MDTAQLLIDHRPVKDFFVGIDSDGCAIDTMNIKHYECFTPCYIKYFDLQPISTLVRETAIFVNLLSTTRGMNRWVTLDLIFDRLKERPEVLARGVTLPEGTELKAFLSSGLPLSGDGIREFARRRPSEEIERCIAWGEGVNRMVEWMVHGCAPFPGVREAFELMNSAADHILLIGDAPGDRSAAVAQGVLWYPIVPGRESESWERLRTEAFTRFLAGTYRGEYEQSLAAEYDAVLLDTLPWEVISR